MEVLLGILIVIIVVFLLSGLAIGIRKVLEFVALRNGYTKEHMPLHYHIFAVSTYFTILFLGMFIVHLFAS